MERSLSSPAKARLFLLPQTFEDAAYPGQKFLCRHGALVEGVLAAHPELLDSIEVERVDFPRPRQVVIASIGEAHQSLPVLVLPEGEAFPAATGDVNGRRFASGAEAILATLAQRHGIPVVHP